jgi:RNA polymerase sigma-70 factor (ECF subfamily)
MMDSDQAFDAERGRLTAIAIRILGSADDANDVLQEAWLRLSHADRDEIDVLPAWLTSVVTRLCLDQLRKRGTRSRAEANAPVGVVPIDPEADSLLAEQVGGAMQLVMETLAPAERVAFVLHDVFGYRFDEIGVVLGRSEPAVRQLASSEAQGPGHAGVDRGGSGDQRGTSTRRRGVPRRSPQW